MVVKYTRKGQKGPKTAKIGQKWPKTGNYTPAAQAVIRHKIDLDPSTKLPRHAMDLETGYKKSNLG